MYQNIMFYSYLKQTHAQCPWTIGLKRSGDQRTRSEKLENGFEGNRIRAKE